MARLFLPMAFAAALAGAQPAAASEAAPYFSAPLWQMKAMEKPVRLHILTDEAYRAAAFIRGVDPTAKAFAAFTHDGAHCEVFVTPATFHLLAHEIRHCQGGHFH